MKATSKINSGDLIEVFIDDIEKYIYLKFIDTRDFYNAVSYPFQFSVHRVFFEKPETSVDFLDFSDLLFSPIHLTGFEILLQSKKWKIVGKLNLTDYDKLPHHYKMAWPPSLTAFFSDIKQWRVLKQINDVNKGEIVPYSRCAHLEYAENLGADHLLLRAMLEFYKVEKLVETFDTSKLDAFEKILFSRYTNMPIYSDIPIEYRGKLLPH